MAKRPVSPQKINLARGLRQKQTDTERIMWNRLRNLQMDGSKFRIQHPIGDYIVAFVCLNKKLVIEIDGGQHNVEDYQFIGEAENIEKDKQRAEWLEAEGYRVLRFWNNDVSSNTEGIFQVILDALKRPGFHPHLNPLPSRERWL